MEAEKGDVSFSVCSGSIQSSASFSSVPSPSSPSGRTEEGTSEAGSSVSRSPGKSAEEVGAPDVWLGVRGEGTADVDASAPGREVGGQGEPVTSEEGVTAAAAGKRVLTAAVVGGSVYSSSGTVAGAGEGKAVCSAGSAGLVAADSTGSSVVRPMAVGASVEGGTVDSVAILREVGRTVIGGAELGWPKVPVGSLVGLGMAGRVVGAGLVVGMVVTTVGGGEVTGSMASARVWVEDMVLGAAEEGNGLEVGICAWKEPTRGERDRESVTAHTQGQQHRRENIRENKGGLAPHPPGSLPWLSRARGRRPRLCTFWGPSG